MSVFLRMFCVGVLLSACGVAMGQLRGTGIPAEEMNSHAASQEKSEWCWAASIQMALSCYDVDVPQEQIVDRTYGHGWDGDPVDHPGSDDAITRNLMGWGVDHGGKQYVVGCIAGKGVPNAAGLLNVLSQKHPVILALANPGAGGGHAVVCTGAYFVDTPFGPQIQAIMIRDPWPYPGWEQTKGRRALSAAEFVMRVRGFWVVTASPLGGKEAKDRAHEAGTELKSQKQSGYNRDRTEPPAAAAEDATSDQATDIHSLESRRDRYRSSADKANERADEYDEKAIDATSETTQQRYEGLAKSEREKSARYSKLADELDEKIDGLKAK